MRCYDCQTRRFLSAFCKGAVRGRFDPSLDAADEEAANKVLLEDDAAAPSALSEITCLVGLPSSHCDTSELSHAHVSRGNGMAPRCSTNHGAGTHSIM
jgi:hypothetical protein